MIESFVGSENCKRDKNKIFKKNGKRKNEKNENAQNTKNEENFRDVGGGIRAPKKITALGNQK